MLNVELEEGGEGMQGTAFVDVADEQLSLAIGRRGQNVRLAAKLTGWKIDVRGSELNKKEDIEKEDAVGAEEKSEEVVEDKSEESAPIVEEEAGASDEEK